MDAWLKGTSDDMSSFICARLAAQTEAGKPATDLQSATKALMLTLKEQALGPLQREAAAWVEKDAGRGGGSPAPKGCRVVIGRQWKGEKLGPQVTVTEIHLRGGDDAAVSGPGKGVECKWRTVDYKDRLKVTKEFADLVGWEADGVEYPQCVVLAVTAAFMATRNGKWPVAHELQVSAGGVRVMMACDSQKVSLLLGALGDYQTLGEAESRLHCHDSRKRRHDHDFKAFPILGIDIFDEGKPTALLVITMDGTGRPALTLVTGRRSGWERSKVAGVLIEG